jgi:2-polyprenyl-6-methoxyphenol hydroxylase-like FAD-dependent oxidoreductase
MRTVHSSTTTQADIVVVGGGFAGLATAAALSTHGAKVTVLEALEGANPTFRGELIHPRGVRALGALGLEQAFLAEAWIPVWGFATFDAPDVTPVLLPYPAESGRGLTMEHTALVASFRRSLTAHPRVRIVHRARVQDLLCEGERVVGVRTGDGGEHRARLVVAADGRHSRVRKLLEIPTSTTLLSYTVALALEGDVLPESEHGHVFVGAPGPILAYPCGPDRVRMCIDVPLDAARGRDALVRFLRERYVPHVPRQVRGAMLRALSESPLGGSANHSVYAEGCALPGVVLVGDAGGCSHPITATGMTSALHDVTTLAECVREEGLTDEALVSYQRRRFRFVRAREAFTHALYDVLRGEAGGALSLRAGIFRYWRGSERARLVSMGILAGEEDSVTTFVAEYLRVVTTSSGVAFRTGSRDRGALEGLSHVAALFGLAKGAVGVALDKAISTVALERAAHIGGLRQSALFARVRASNASGFGDAQRGVDPP